MKRVIYSLYVDVPATEHYGQSKQKSDTVAKAQITVKAFKKHYKRLIDSKRKYANRIGASFIVKFIPKQILHATARVMAFILAALATQFIIDGIKASFNI